ncbi:MAG TPA: primosomal protein N' [Candidatus Binatia bacterium]|jgi:primosomal protein N' (replication factor Y)
MHGRGLFAQVIVPSPINEPLIYEVPTDLRDRLEIGMRVTVPLGKRRVAGIVVAFVSETHLTQVKQIIEIPDEKPVMDGPLLRLSEWMARYYLSSIGEVLATILPANVRREARRTVAASPREFPVAGGLQKRILTELRSRKGATTVKALARRFPGGGFYRALDSLVKMEAVKIRERPMRLLKNKRPTPPSYEPSGTPNRGKFALTSEQQGALRAIGERLDRGGFESFLLYGVTGSGKTEVYLRAMENARLGGRRSLIMVPEISLTPQLLDRLNERFPGRVGVLHSGLTQAQRWNQWWDIVRGNVDVVVGARSAIFAPLPDLGLIVVDEEHDPSYKQEEGLRYHARDLAVVRGKLLNCPVVLGSATPAVESFENCRGGRYTLLELTERVERRPLPKVVTLDLRSQKTGPGDSNDEQPLPGALLSPALKDALKENLGRGLQSLIFLNRRGFANFLQCRLCGFVLRCTHCSVAMTFHRKQQSVLCHHCGARKPARDVCPGCGHRSLMPIGAGTEQLEQELCDWLPHARIARMDRDTTGKRGSHERLIRQWENGEIDVLLGTQMITKGHDVSGVTLVGAVLADLSLNLPDFRAAERTFQLLSQVAGRAGRGQEPGRVIVQTYTPDHYAFQHVQRHDYKSFFAAESEFRRALNYPPFSRLVHLRLDGTKPQEVEKTAKDLGTWLRAQCQRQPSSYRDIEVLGPAPAPITKLRGRYRWQILLKGKKGPALLRLAGQTRTVVPRSMHVRLHIDVDPYNML